MELDDYHEEYHGGYINHTLITPITYTQISILLSSGYQSIIFNNKQRHKICSANLLIQQNGLGPS